MCAEQTPRLTAAEARETAPPPTSVDGKDAFVRVCFVFSKDYNLLKSRKPLKKAVWLSVSFILPTWINKSFGHYVLNDKGLLEI